MEIDPGETMDIAVAHPDIVKQVSEEFDGWFADISREGLRRFPLPVGHREHNPVELHAPQAYHDMPLTFPNGPGFANDWLTSWTDPKAKVWFEIDIATADDYEIELSFACPTSDAGSRLRINAGGRSIETIIPAALAKEIRLPYRDQNPRYRNRKWAILTVGTLELATGPHKLTLEPLTMPGSRAIDLMATKHSSRHIPWPVTFTSGAF